MTNDKDKFFGIRIVNTKTIVLFWFCVMIATYFISQIDTESGYFEQLAIRPRNLFYLVLYIYSAQRIVFAGLNFNKHLKAVLDRGDSSPAFGHVILGLCILVAGIMIAGGNVLVSTM